MGKIKTVYNYNYRLTPVSDLMLGSKITGDAIARTAVVNAVRLNLKADAYAHAHRNEWNPRFRYLTKAIDWLAIDHERKMLGCYLAECKQYGGRMGVNKALRKISSDAGAGNLLHGRGYDIMESMFPAWSFFCCIDCDHVGLAGDQRTRNDGEPLCEDCATNSYYYNPEEDNYQDEQYSSPSSIIGEYHSSKYKVKRIPSKYDDRKPRVLLGLELEMECTNNRETVAHALRDRLSDYTARDGRTYDYAFFERDNSISSGFEMVTSWTGLDVHEEMIKRGFSDLLAGAKSHNTTTCGLHVHVCKSTMTTLHASKLILFINDARNAPMITALARRDNASYAKFSDKKKDFKTWARPLIDQTVRGYRGDALRGLNRDRYEALNFQGDHTVEFRLFKGSLKFQTIMACLEFSFLSWHFTKDASVADLTERAFCSFISRDAWLKDSRYLRQYLHAKGFNVAYKAPASALPKTVVSAV